MGVIERICGEFGNPEELAYGRDGSPKQALYRVRFKQNEVWEDYDRPRDTGSSAPLAWLVIPSVAV